MSTAETIVGIAAGLVVNELCEVSPWAARKIVVWSAHLQYGQVPRAEVRAEEHAALIDARPGKLLKLITALSLAGGAVAAYGKHAVTKAIARRVRRAGIRLLLRQVGRHDVEFSVENPGVYKIIVHRTSHRKLIGRVERALGGVMLRVISRRPFT